MEKQNAIITHLEVLKTKKSSQMPKRPIKRQQTSNRRIIINFSAKNLGKLKQRVQELSGKFFITKRDLK